MDPMDTQRRRINKRQSHLRIIMTSFDQHNKAMGLFEEQHASLHSSLVSNLDIWSFEDAILDEITEQQFRRFHKNSEHSIAWCIWHIARIEDIAMNYLVAGSQQIFITENWREKLKVDFLDSGNEMSMEEKIILSDHIHLDELRNYRISVGKRTREITRELQPETLKEKVQLNRIQQIKDDGAVVETAYGITDYWSKRDIAGLLLMPATRHNLVHLNESLQMKRKRG